MTVVSKCPFALIVIVFISSCVNPFSSAVQDDAEYDSASLRIVVDNEDGVRTILPTGYTAAELTYSATLTPDGGGDPLQLGNQPHNAIAYIDIAAGNYDLEVTAFDGASRMVYSSGSVSVVVATGPNTISVELLPLRGNSGGLALSVIWPAEHVDSVNVYWSNAQADLLQAAPAYITNNLVINTGTGELSITTTDSEIASGTWYLSVHLVAGGEVAARIIEAVHIYDYLVSEAGFVLTTDRISRPPAAPTFAQVELTGAGYFSVTWTDNANTEVGYHLYEGAPGAGTLQSTVSAANQIFDNVFVVPDTITNFYITAYNDFGESEPLEFDAVTIDTFGVFLTSVAPAVYSEWAPSDVLLDWDSALGADSYNLYLSQNETQVQAYDASVLVANLSAGGIAPAIYVAINPGEQWFWSLEAVNAYGSVPADYTESFTIRDAIYIENLNGNDANIGSRTAPLFSITEGVIQALDGETITVLDGNYLYSEYGLVIDKDIVLQAENFVEIDNTTFDTGPTITMSQGTLRNFSIQPAESDPDPRVSIRITNTQAPVLLENLRVVVSDYGIELPDAGNYQHEIVISNNQFAAYAGSVAFYAGTGTYAVPIHFDSNQIQIWNSQAQDVPVYGVYRRDGADVFITNNVIENRVHTSGANRFYAVHAEGAGSVHVLHNSFINRNDFMQGRLIEHADTNTVLYIANNIFYGNGTAIELVYASDLDATPAQMHSNLFFGIDQVGYTLVNQWLTADDINGEAWATGNVAVDPVLDVQDVPPYWPDDWYAPTNASPDALTVGGSTTWLGTVPEDRLGITRSDPVSVGPFQVLANSAPVDTVYVAHPDEGGNDLNLGTVGYPLSTITAAIAQVDAGGIVEVGPGLFRETVLVNKTISLNGSGDATILRAAPGDGTTLNLTAAGSAARNVQVRPGDTGTRGAVRLGAQNTTIEDSLITEDPDEPNGTTLRGISAVSSGGVIRNNRIRLADADGGITHSMSSRFAINPTQPATELAPGIIEGNHIYFGSAPGGALGIQANDYYIVRNNIIQQGGTDAGSFTGIRVVFADSNRYLIVNNTVVNTNPNLSSVRLITIDSTANPVVTNNIMFSNGIGTGFNLNNIDYAAIELHNNLFYGLQSLMFDGNVSLNITGINDNAYAQSNIEIDPQIAEGTFGGNNWWAPTVNSPIGFTEGGSGAWLAEVPVDVLGTTRTVPVSIGAYEYD